MDGLSYMDDSKDRMLTLNILNSWLKKHTTPAEEVWAGKNKQGGKKSCMLPPLAAVVIVTLLL